MADPTKFDVVQANCFIGPNRPTRGKTLHVAPYSGADGNSGESPNRPLKTLAAAKAKCVSGRGDRVYFYGEGNAVARCTDYLSTGLDWNVDGVEIIGVNSGCPVGQRARIAPLSTATAIATLFTLSANDCIVRDIGFFHGAGSTDPSAASTCMLVSGDHNVIAGCQVSGIGDTKLDDAGSNSLTVSGAENLFVDDYIGLNTVIRATSVTEVILSGSAARNTFRSTHFDTYTSGSTFKMITIPTTLDRWAKFEDCLFTAAQNITSAVAPTGVFGVTTCNGRVYVVNPYVDGFAQLVTADNAYVRVLGNLGYAVASGNLVGIAQQVDVA